jgi:hypothetical protein
MALALGQNFDDGQPLRRHLVAVIPKFPDNGVKSIFMICQLPSLYDK